VKYDSIYSIDDVLKKWWSLEGLPWRLLQQAAEVTAATTEAGATLSRLSQKLVADYARKGDDGKPLRIKDEQGNETPLWDFGDNKATADAEWQKIMALEFECPTLSPALLDENSEKLGLTLEVATKLRPVIAPE
jgi:hypothetical protein